MQRLRAARLVRENEERKKSNYLLLIIYLLRESHRSRGSGALPVSREMLSADVLKKSGD